MNTPYKNPIRILATIALILSIFLVRATVASLSDHSPAALPIASGLLIVIRGISIIFIFIDKKTAAICLLATTALFGLNALLLTHYLFIPAFITDLVLGILALISARKTMAPQTPEQSS
ncbi:hypothetical protein D3C71_89000 [compost metagenome]